MRIDELLARLAKVRKSGNGQFMACCPAHDDRHPSLSISEKNGGIYMHCHTGCEKQSVLAALGLQLRDLMPEHVGARHDTKHRPAITNGVTGNTPDFAKVWQDALPCELHPYLTRKRVRSYGLRHNAENLLLVPMRDTDGAIHGIQRIWPNGDKRHWAGSKVRGHFYQIGVPRGPVVLCEGYATGASLYEHLGWLTIICFDAGNLEPVAGNLRRVYRSARFLFAADNDAHTQNNTGITKARAAAKRYGGKVVWPTFKPGDNGTDFNDCANKYGAAVIEALHDK